MPLIRFEELEVFKRAYRISLEIHRTSLAFPKIEQHALADQIRRCSKGICANLAEGFAKSSNSKAELRRFLSMAIGSADEMRGRINNGHACAAFFPRGEFGFIISPGNICERRIECSLAHMWEVIQDLDVELTPDQFIEPDLCVVFSLRASSFAHGLFRRTDSLP